MTPGNGGGSSDEGVAVNQPDVLPDLFGEEPPDVFQTALERYGLWPITVWELKHADPKLRELKAAIADDGTARSGCLRKGPTPNDCYGYAASVFSPAIAAWALNLWAPEYGVCFDPFAGGGTRAIMAAKHGLKYVGTELRQVEVEAVQGRCERAGCAERVRIIRGDAMEASSLVPHASADFLLTCPPYWNLETYNGGPRDLSAYGWSHFVDALKRVVQETWTVMKPGALAVWVVGLHRDKGGELMPIHHVVAAAHREAGFKYREEVVIYNTQNGALQRVGNFEKGRRLLVRSHEYVQVFRKGATV
jgi:DNA modification methylase